MDGFDEGTAEGSTDGIIDMDGFDEGTAEGSTDGSIDMDGFNEGATLVEGLGLSVGDMDGDSEQNASLSLEDLADLADLFQLLQDLDDLEDFSTPVGFKDVLGMEEMVGSPEGALDVLGMEEMVGSSEGRVELDGLGEPVGDLRLLDPFESLLELLPVFESPCATAAKMCRSRCGRVTVRRSSGLAFADKARPSSTRMLAEPSLLREASFIILIKFRNAQIHDF
eukprot:scaffold29883_cov48-Attheya_sp.AAC.8